MIPKIIHMVWLSGEPYPALVRRCLRSWRRVLPDYELKIWTMDNFDTQAVRYVREAVSVRKWAPASDYIRLWALYNYGGVYMDSDVFVRRNFGRWMESEVFSAIECSLQPIDREDYVDEQGRLLDESIFNVPGIGLQAAVVASVKGHPFVRRCMDYFEREPYILPDGSYANSKFIAPSIFARMAVDFGFRYVDREQHLDQGILILPSAAISSTLRSVGEQALAIHCCNGNWNLWVRRTLRQKLYRRAMPLLLMRIEWRDRLRRLFKL